MSERGDIEIIRGGYEAFLRGDLETVFSLFAPDIEARDDQQAIGDPVYRGVEGFARMLTVTSEGFEDLQFFVDEITDAGDRILVAARRSGRGAISGATVEERQYHVWELRDGRAVRFHSFLSRADALRAAGLDP